MLAEVLRETSLSESKQAEVRQVVLDMFGNKCRRIEGQTKAGWRETLKLMIRAAQGRDGKLKAALGVKAMTVFPVLDVYYRK